MGPTWKNHHSLLCKMCEKLNLCQQRKKKKKRKQTQQSLLGKTALVNESCLLFSADTVLRRCCFPSYFPIYLLKFQHAILLSTDHRTKPCGMQTRIKPQCYLTVFECLLCDGHNTKHCTPSNLLGPTNVPRSRFYHQLHHLIGKTKSSRGDKL